MDAPTPNDAKRTARVLTAWCRHAAELVFPRNCPLCSRALGTDDPGCICPFCIAAFPRIEPPMCHWCGRPVRGAVENEFVCSQCLGKRLHYDRAYSACLADTKMLDAIHRFKYQREVYFAPSLAQVLVECAARHVPWSELDAIVPVPLHARKQRQRHFNQARILADALGTSFDKPVLDYNLRRVVDTPSQTFLDADERRKNLRDAFRARRPAEFSGKRIVLVDDVFTTGSTANVCAHELKKAGVASVFVLTLARAY